MVAEKYIKMLFHKLNIFNSKRINFNHIDILQTKKYINKEALLTMNLIIIKDTKNIKIISS